MSHLLPREVIHCLQSQGSPAAAEQHCTIKTRATLGTWGGRSERPLFLPLSHPTMALSTASSSYWRATRAPRYSLTFAFPLLVAYEVLAFTLSHDSLAGVRNGADVLLKSVFVLVGRPERAARLRRAAGRHGRGPRLAGSAPFGADRGPRPRADDGRGGGRMRSRSAGDGHPHRAPARRAPRRRSAAPGREVPAG